MEPEQRAPASRIDRPLLRQLLALGMVGLGCWYGVLAATTVATALVPLWPSSAAAPDQLAQVSRLLPQAAIEALAALLLLRYAKRWAGRLSGDIAGGREWSPWARQVLWLGLGLGGCMVLLAWAAELPGAPLSYVIPSLARAAAGCALLVAAFLLCRRAGPAEPAAPVAAVPQSAAGWRAWWSG